MPLGRFSLAGLVLSCLLAMTAATAKAGAQALEGTVRIVPAAIAAQSSAEEFTLFVVLEDLDHHGVLTYDDNRDDVPDRQVVSEGLGAFEFTIRFDPAILAPLEATAGPDLGRTGRPFQCLRPDEKRGEFSFGCISFGTEPAGTQGTVTLAAVTFRALATGTSPLDLDVVLAGPLGSDQVPVAVHDGSVTVGAPLPQRSATVSDIDDASVTPEGRGVLPVVPNARPGRLWRAGTVGEAIASSGRPVPEAQTETQRSDDGMATGVWLAISIGAAAIVAGAGLGGLFWWRHNREMGHWGGRHGS